MKRKFMLYTGMVVFLILSGCITNHEIAVRPVEIRPIYITIDVNINTADSLNGPGFQSSEKKEKP